MSGAAAPVAAAPLSRDIRNRIFGVLAQSFAALRGLLAKQQVGLMVQSRLLHALSAFRSAAARTQRKLHILYFRLSSMYLMRRAPPPPVFSPLIFLFFSFEHASLVFRSKGGTFVILWAFLFFLWLLYGLVEVSYCTFPAVTSRTGVATLRDTRTKVWRLRPNPVLKTPPRN